MKKGIVFLVAALFLLGGCGKNEVVCSGKVEEDGKTYEVKVTGTLKDDKIASVKASMVFGDKETTDQFCSIMSLINSFAEDDSKKVDYKCDGTTITIENYQNMADSDEESPIGKTKEEFIELMTKDSDEQVTCK